MASLDEEGLLRSVALQNAQSILLARQRAESELVRAKEDLERKTRELDRSLAMMRATLESTTDGILVTDGTGKVTSFNARFVEMWRLADDRLKLAHHQDVLKETSRYFADPARFLARIEEIYATAPRESFDLLEFSDGTVIERLSRVQFVDDENVGRVWSFRDITTRKRAEEARARLASIVESSHDAIISKSIDGVILTWNAGAEQLLGHSAAEAVGRPVSLIVPEDRREEEASILRRLEHGERIDELETVRLSKHGRRIDVSLTISPIIDDDGRLIAVSSIARDITVRKQVELENANLLAALKEADRRKDEFLAMLAHELRNPLAPIRNAAQIIRLKGPPAPDLQWAREVIDRQVQQMTRLVDDLLDLSRISRGKIELRKRRIELAAIVNSAVEASRPLMEKWGHELTVTIPDDPIYLDGDLTRLSQALLNLLNNAAKYTEQAGRIWLSAEERGGDVLIRVRDNGVGIPAEMLSRIFDMFTQVDRTLERAQGGLGIGLTLVRQLVEMHGGRVDVMSGGVGQGSEFIVRLPVSRSRRDVDGQPTDPDSVGAAAFPNCRVLVVDDNKDAADSLGMLLRASGSEVRTANDGLQAVGAASVFRPEVVLMDIGLPKLNGYDAARRIRTELGDEVVLVAVTGWGQEEDRRRSHDAGFDHHLTKPLAMETLQKLLAEHTRRSRTRAG
jgi:PAS domain S-box-containing protein